ncbi:MAG: CoA transferase [Leptospiraceae bacterium]|nr:CoA transferase [Leptospiraceae bacterium]MCK6382413.1 CoA transferase [Leptospiraceae bacterium]NUM41118.1 CoA transferase [Leptospiraceae bacterium]
MNKGALAGIRVVDLSLLLPGPLCSMYLGDMGAEVIKVENPRAYDGTRAMQKNENGFAGSFHLLNRNKKAITLNLKKPESKEILFRLLEKSDILLEGFRPSTLDEMGIGYDTLKEKFPRLIYCGISGYGISGPYKDLAGHDGNYLSLSGLLDQMGTKDSPPSLAGFQVADIGGGTLIALSGILAALYSREKTGKGQRIDVSMMEGSLQFLSLYAGGYISENTNPKRGDEILSGKLPNYSVYEIQNNRYVFLGALEERFFRTFLRHTNLESILEEFPYQEKNFGNIKEKIRDYFLKQNEDSLKNIFENKDTCLTLVKKISEVFQDPHLKERKSIFYFEHPVYGKIPQFAAPFRFSETPCEYRLHAPEHGEHNLEVFKVLGYSENAIIDLKKNRII